MIVTSTFATPVAVIGWSLGARPVATVPAVTEPAAADSGDVTQSPKVTRGSGVMAMWPKLEGEDECECHNAAALEAARGIQGDTSLGGRTNGSRAATVPDRVAGPRLVSRPVSAETWPQSPH